MRIIDYMVKGETQRILDEMPEFTEQAIAESDGGAFSWLLSTLDVPDYPAILHGYGTIIGTGNAIVEWPCHKYEEAEV
jgi:2-aminophenol/2-amino-5-chlorophenol 1,6-dioxygenase beta subunit